MHERREREKKDMHWRRENNNSDRPYTSDNFKKL
jgi:hypothetical protein